MQTHHWLCKNLENVYQQGSGAVCLFVLTWTPRAVFRARATAARRDESWFANEAHMLQGWEGKEKKKKKISGYRLSCSLLAKISSSSFGTEGCNYGCEMRSRAGQWRDGAGRGKGHAGRSRDRGPRVLTCGLGRKEQRLQLKGSL